MKFTDIEYLKDSNEKQRLAYVELEDIEIFEILNEYSPVLAGTIPLSIDIEGSDLDILCEVSDFHKFVEIVTEIYSTFENFSWKQKSFQERESIVVNFNASVFPIEIIAQDLPVNEQIAYRHMIKEYEILQLKDSSFRRRVIDLKRQGLSTEEEFGELLDLNGDVYEELLKVKT